jgi:DNA-binding NarL/FixJ family response regulator
VRVLIVDDHTAFRAATRELLERRGHEVAAEAASGVEALDAAARLELDLVLLDVRLDDESGVDVARALATARPGLAVVLMSADTSPPSDAFAAGARAYVSKRRLHTVDLEQLARRVD